MQLIDRDGRLTPVLKILTDYPRDDLAHDEVHQSLVTACVTRGLYPANIDVGSIASLDTIVAGFKTAQLVFNSKLGYGHIFHTNCAPRKNIVSVKSAGEKIVLGMTASGVVLLAVNAGYTLAPFHDAVKAGEMVFFQTSVPDSGSQFRSRDYFPDAMADLTLHLATRFASMGEEKIRQTLKARGYRELLEGLSYLGEPLNISSFPQLPEGTIYYIDNFGNMKLNMKHAKIVAQYKPGTPLVAAIGNTVCDVVVGDVGFSMGEGVVAITSGSSGWALGAGEKEMFAEIFLRGGRADSHFPGAKTGDQLLAMTRADLERVIETLKGASGDVSGRHDLYNISEARIMHMLARARLLNGFDSSELQKAFAANDLEKRLMA